MIFLIPLLALLDIFATLFACLFVNWWAPLFVVSAGADASVHLAPWLKWFDTFDDPLAPGEVQTYWSRVRWLYRNPAYGFSYWALGVPFDPAQWRVVTYTGFDSIDQNGFTFHAVGPAGAFNWEGVRGGLMIKIGWKAWNMYYAKEQQWRTKPWGPVWRIPFVFSVKLAG